MKQLNWLKIWGVIMMTATPAALAAGNTAQLQLVDHVDLDRFMGDWYVIANIPTIFEKNAVNAVENYTWNAEKDRVDVTFTWHRDDPQNKQKRMTQKGFIQNTDSNAEWQVQPLWPFKFDYLIIDLDVNYSYTVIGVPSRKYAWIMARETSLDETTYSEIVDRLKDQGYDIGRIQKVPQIW